MDNSGWTSYFCTMFRRVIALLAVLSFAVVTAVTAAHAARTTLDDTVVAAHASHMMTKADAGNFACGEKFDCGASEAGKCATACASVLSCIAPTQVDAFEDHFTTTHVRPADMTTLGRSPALSERPPKTRLL